MKVELVLSNHATKADLKKATGKNTPTNFSNLKSKVDKFDVDKSVSVTINLSKLRDVVKNVIKKDVHNLEQRFEDKMPIITNLATNTTLYTTLKMLFLTLYFF